MGDNALFVTLMGMGTVFVGLICIVVLCMIMSAIVRSFTKKPEPVKTQAAVQSAPAGKPAVIANKQEFVAAVSAALAEDMGTDITGIRILSVKQL